MKDYIQLPMLLAGFQTKADGSIKLTFETRELRELEAGKLYGMRNSEAWFTIATSQLKEVRIPNEKPDPALGTKTQSQRLRGVLFRYWEQNTTGMDFESYYRLELERLIDQWKERLQ